VKPRGFSDFFYGEPAVLVVSGFELNEPQTSENSRIVPALTKKPGTKSPNGWHIVQMKGLLHLEKKLIHLDSQL
jgi:hypothetical protein